jgi:ABC-type phosphate transport system permease subunit
MYEHKSQRLLPLRLFYRRVLKNILLALFIFFISMIIGVVGFCLTADSSWIDAFHNSAMLLSGMGPVLQSYPTVGAKLFSSFYALFGGIVFITNIGVILAPVMHRIFHRLHLEKDATS